MTDEQKPPVIEVTSLADLGPRTIIVNLEREDGVLQIKCRTLSYQRWQQIGWEVADPTPPVVGAGKHGPIYNHDDPAYKAALMQASDERMYRRLLEFVQIEVPGRTVEQKLARLRETLEAGVVRHLAQVMGAYTRDGSARIEGRANSFRGDGANGTAHMPGDGVDAESVDSDD